jgi:hypothetical protein
VKAWLANDASLIIRIRMMLRAMPEAVKRHSGQKSDAAE